MKYDKKMLSVLLIFSLCFTCSSCNKTTHDVQTDTDLPTLGESDENGATEDKLTSSEPVCEHSEYKQSNVEPTKTSLGYTLCTCTKCGYSYRTNFTGVFGAEISTDTELNILFIGNSYTYYNSSWNIFKKICLSKGYTVRVDHVTCGGYSLAQMNDPYNSYGAQVAEKLKKQKYDVVIMQEQSLRPATNDKALFYDAVRGLTKKIKENGAIPVLYETWGRKAGSADLIINNLTSESMTQKLIASYGAIAEELSIDVSHVGTAFYDLYTNNPKLNVYDTDLSHPSAFGSYIVALTHYATIFGKSPIDIEYKYFDDAENQAIAEKAVYDAVFGKSILKNEYKTSSKGVSALS